MIPEITNKLISLVIVSFIFCFRTAGQAPNWVPSTPSVGTVGPMTIPVNYGIDRTGIVYICAYNFDNLSILSSTDVKNLALGGPSGTLVSTAALPVGTSDINTVKTQSLEIIDAGRLHSVFIVAESTTGELQAAPVKLTATTLACPKIDILTGFTQPVQCVNKGTTATFQLAVVDPNTSGILKGTQWFLDWGDGITSNYTSTSDNDLPPLALRTHTYTSPTNCNYVFYNSITNPCGEIRGVQYVAIVHGRDISSDGDGMLRIVNNANGNSVIQVCEGTQSIVTLRDNSTWNCQNPVVPGGLTPIPNSDPRNIEWLYGRDPDGAFFNTITGSVTIATLGNAPQTSGRINPLPYGPSSLSQAITIPATARAGQFFRVYLKNWNKCNWSEPEYISTYVDIQVVASQTPPTVPNRRICSGADRTLTVTSTPFGTISWYGNAALTNLLGTGISFIPGQAAAGIYNYWVTDRDLSAIQCQSSATMVTLTIDTFPQKPTLLHPQNENFCFDNCLTTYTITAGVSTPPVVTSYQWYKNGVALAGETNQSISICRLDQTGSYTVAAVGPAPSFCQGPQSDPWYVIGHTLSNITNPVPATICQNQTATFTAWTTDEVQTWQWEYSTDGGNNFNTIGSAPPYSGFNTNTLTITNPPVSFNGYLYRVVIKTPPGQGGCSFKSDTARLKETAMPVVNAGPPVSACTPIPNNPIPMTGATITGTWATAIWTGGAGLGTWNQNNNNPAQAYFIPSVPSASFTATLTITGATPCGSVIVNGTRNIVWSQTPIVEAGPNISRCDAAPLAPIIMTGAATTGTYSGLAWSGGPGLGTWIQNANPALATFIPSVPNGSFTATLTVTGSSGCLGTNPIDTRFITWGQTPVANAGPNISRCDLTPMVPISMTQATATGSFSVEMWSGGAGLGTWTQNANPALATFTPGTNYGSFTATLTLSGTGACIGTNSTSTRLIEWSRAATVNAGPDQSVCALSSATLAGSIGGSAVTATWTGGTGTFAPNNTTLNAVYTPSAAERTAQTVTLTLTTNDPAGICPPVSDNMTVAIGTVPLSAILTSSGDACYGASSSWLNVLVSNGVEPYTISYTLNGVPRPDITSYINNTHFNLGTLPSGTYTYSITQLRDNCGNILSGAGINPVTFQIYQNAVANAGSDQGFCGILTASLAAIPSIGVGTWSVVSGPGTINFSPNANDPNANITASNYGSYVLRWTEINGGICTSSSDKAIIFEREANAGPSQDLCGILTATLAGNTPAVGQGAWTLVSGPGTAVFTPNANSPSAIATVSAFGSYVFRWTLSNGIFCNTNSTVTIRYNPVGQVNQPPDMFVCSNMVTSPVSFTTTNTGGITTYTWTNNNPAIGLPFSGSGDIPSFTAVNTGTSPVTGFITVVPTFNNGYVSCQGTPITFLININPTPSLISPSVIPDICSNTAVNYAPTSTIAGTTFAWTRSVVAGITPAGPTSGMGNPNEILRNQSNTAIDVIYQYLLTANGCISFQTVSVNVKPESAGTISGGKEICRDSSAVITMVFTGTPPYSFTYSNGTSNFAVPNYPNSVYNISVTPATTSTYTLVSLVDGNGCSGTISGSAVVSINNPPVLTLDGTNLTCNGNYTGAVNITVTGNGPFTYTWSGPAGYNSGTEDISGLGAGNYQVNITDAKGCKSSGSVILTEPGGLNAMLAYTDITCFGSENGSITISLPVGGSGSYLYTINGGITWISSGSFTGLVPGTYDVRMRDAMNPGCYRILNAALVINSPAQLNATVSSSTVSCRGANDGSILISNPSGGAGIYEYSINGGASWKGSGSHLNLAPGVYDVRIRDASYTPCERTLNPSLVITEPPQLTATVTRTDISCSGANNGTISITSSSGGYGTYEYSISGGVTWMNSGFFTGLSSGSYDVRIRDASRTGCTVVLDPALTISAPGELNATLQSSNVTCTGANDGIISVSSPSGGHGTYEHSINGGISWMSSGSFTGLQPGNYNVQIRDAVQPTCIRVLNSALVISEPAQLTASVNKIDNSCTQSANGSITISGPAGGYGTYEYTINGGSTWSSSGIFNNLISGTYDVRMRDAAHSGCTFILNPALQINTTDIVTLSSTLTPPPLCSGSVFSYGATSTNPSASFEWTRPAVAGIIEPAHSGTGDVNEILTNNTTVPVSVNYIYTVTAYECSNVQIVTVTVYPSPSAQAGGSQTICQGNSATINGAAFSNGTVLWTSNGMGSLNGSTTLTPTYTPAISDAGKTITLTMTVTGSGACSSQIAEAYYSVFVKENQNISFAPIANKVYGDPPFVLDATADSFLEVNFTSSDTSVVTISGRTANIVGAGSATIYANQPGDLDHCPASQISQVLNVTPKPIVVKADPSQSKIYGDADPALTYSVSPSMAGTDRLTGTPGRTAGENIGSYVITQGTLDAGHNYLMTFVPDSFRISVKPITIKVNPGQGKTYGSVDPSLKYDVIPAMIPGDIVSGSLNRTFGEYPGNYVIGQGTLSPGNNYSVTFMPAEFIISKATLYATADNKQRYFLEQNPDLTITYSGFVLGEGINVIDNLPEVSIQVDSTCNAGTYDIDVTGGADDNYTIVCIRGILTVLKANQQIITFNELPKFLRTTEQFQLEASASSGLPVTFESSDENKATIDGNVMTIVKEGAVDIIARQDGDQNWNPAPPVYQKIIGQPTFDNITSMFTPNSDGMNDHWHIVDIDELGSVEVKVYNRFGKLVYESSDYKNDWRGDFNGRPLPAASYYYIIKSSEKGIIKGVVNIVR